MTPTVTIEPSGNGRAKILIGVGGVYYPISAVIPDDDAAAAAERLREAFNAIGGTPAARGKQAFRPRPVATHPRTPSYTAAEKAFLDAAITKAVADHGASSAQILSFSRERHVVRARRAVWAQLRTHGWGYHAIARVTGFEHTTVIDGLRKVGGATATPSKEDQPI